MPFEGGIEEIWAQYDKEHLTIYKAGGPLLPSISIPQGASWELHVKTKALWNEVAPFATAVTVGGGDVVAGNAKMWGGDYEFAFGMGVMPAMQVNLGRIRFWKNRANTNVPPLVGER